ncbi:MAG: FecR family protein [Syntrophales bacterium]
MTRKRAITLKSIAISLLLQSLLLILSSLSFAETEIGRVTHLSGPLFAKKVDGTTRVLSTNSAVEQRDTLVTEKKTYARIKFTDGGEVNMRPGTQIKVSEYSFDQTNPKEDKVVFNLVKGGIRSITGMIGKRGDQDSYKLLTDTAVAGIRGTTYECKICQGNCGSIPNGLYLFVLQGVVNVSNNAGSQNLSAGQYVYVQAMTSIPQILPGNPGIDFTLPTVIGDSPKESGTKKVDPGCVVR